MPSWSVVLSVILVGCTSASNILIWNPTIGHSHVKFLGNIADVLTASGHNVTIFSPLMDPHVTTFGNTLPARTLRFIPHDGNDEWLKMEFKGPSLWDSPPCHGLCLKWVDYDVIYKQSLNYCEDLLEDNQMMNLLKELRFELAYTETFDACAPGVFQVLGIKNMVLVSALGMVPRIYEVIGIPEVPSFMPLAITPYSDSMTFLERLTNFKISLQLRYYIRKWEHEAWKLFNAKHPGFPSIQEIYAEKTALVMTNVNEFAETPRPTVNMVRYVGGSTLHDSQPLSKDLDQLLKEREANVLFSLGSLVLSKDMPRWLKNDIVETFKLFPNVTFIWKYEGDDISHDAHPNIHTMKWVPQTDLLSKSLSYSLVRRIVINLTKTPLMILKFLFFDDSRMSLFITHGGMNSMLEAMFHGVAMIVIPLFGDQQLNSKNIQQRGIGTLVDRNKLNKKTLTEAIHKTLYDKKINREVKFVASLLAGRPQQYRDDIAKWAKIIIEHGRMNHLILQSRNLSFVQYYCLDIIAFYVSIAIAVLSSSLYLLRRIFSSLRNVKLKSN